MTDIVHVNQNEVAPREIYPGVRRRLLWRAANGAKAQILEIDPGASFLKLDVHHPGPEEIYVVSGIFNDGALVAPSAVTGRVRAVCLLSGRLRKASHGGSGAMRASIASTNTRIFGARKRRSA